MIIVMNVHRQYSNTSAKTAFSFASVYDIPGLLCFTSCASSYWTTHVIDDAKTDNMSKSSVAYRLFLYHVCPMFSVRLLTSWQVHRAQKCNRVIVVSEQTLHTRMRNMRKKGRENRPERDNMHPLETTVQSATCRRAETLGVTAKSHSTTTFPVLHHHEMCSPVHLVNTTPPTENNPGPNGPCSCITGMRMFRLELSMAGSEVGQKKTLFSPPRRGFEQTRRGGFKVGYSQVDQAAPSSQLKNTTFLASLSCLEY